MSNLIVESIKQLASVFLITEGRYDLTADAMRLRGQRPLVSGDDYKFEFTLYQLDGTTVVDLTGSSIRFTAKYAVTDVDGLAIINKVATIVTPTAGRFDVVIDKSDITDTSFKQGTYQIQLTDSGSKTRTILTGPIEFLANVAQTVP